MDVIGVLSSWETFEKNSCLIFVALTDSVTFTKSKVTPYSTLARWQS